MAEPPAGQHASAGRPDPAGEAGMADAVRRVFAEVFPGLDPSDVFPKAAPADVSGLYAGLFPNAAPADVSGLFAGLGNDAAANDDDVPPWSHPPV